MESILKVDFAGFKCYVEFWQYENGRHAIDLMEVGTGEPVATATTNLPHWELEKDEMFIKNYSENAGILDALASIGVISQPIAFITTPYVKIPKVKFLLQKLELCRYTGEMH